MIEKFSKNIISKREPDDSFEMSTFYQGASAVVLAGNSCLIKYNIEKVIVMAVLCYSEFIF